MRQNRLPDWQFKQAVDALRLLLVDLTNTPVGQAVDWLFWREAVRSLEPNHATLARTELVADLTERVAHQTGLDEAYRASLQQMLSLIRARHCSIRTEQTYMGAPAKNSHFFVSARKHRAHNRSVIGAPLKITILTFL